MGLRSHDETMIATMANIAAIPKAIGIGRYVERSGRIRSSGANGMNPSISSSARWTPSRTRPVVATN